MKTLIKITLLIVALALSVWGVLYWKDTVAKEPPTEFEFVGDHSGALSHSISWMNSQNENDFVALERAYDDCVYQWRRFQDEHLVSNSQANEQKRMFLDGYVRKFVAKSNACFDQSEWDIAPWNHDFMKNKIEELKQLNDGEMPVQLRGVNVILNGYDEVIERTKYTKFISLNKSIEYDKYLSNLTSNNPILGKLINCQLLVAKSKEAEEMRFWGCINQYTSEKSRLTNRDLFNGSIEMSSFTDFLKKCNEAQEYYSGKYYNSSNEVVAIINALFDDFDQHLENEIAKAQDVGMYKYVKHQEGQTKAEAAWAEYNNRHDKLDAWLLAYCKWMNNLQENRDNDEEDILKNIEYDKVSGHISKMGNLRNRYYVNYPREKYEEDVFKAKRDGSVISGYESDTELNF